MRSTLDDDDRRCCERDVYFCEAAPTHTQSLHVTAECLPETATRPSRLPRAHYARGMLQLAHALAEADAPTVQRERLSFDEIRRAAQRFAVDEGRNATPNARVTVFRFDHPTRVTKTTSYGMALSLVLSGRQRVQVVGHTADAGAGELSTITRSADVEVSFIETPFTSVNVCFCPSLVAESFVALAEAGDEPLEGDASPLFVSDAEPRLVGALSRMLLALSDPVEQRVLVPLAERELLFHLLRSPAAATLRASIGEPADRQRILDAMKFIRDNASKRLSVRDLARVVAMSPSHFAHRFSEVTRVSPMRYLRDVRLETARTLLANGERVNAAARAVGFESASHFTREFKRRYGQSPTTFKVR